MADKPFFKRSVIDETTVSSEDKELAENPPLATTRVRAQGDWAASNNPSPEEQAKEVARGEAIKKVAAGKNPGENLANTEGSFGEHTREENFGSTRVNTVDNEGNWVDNNPSSQEQFDETAHTDTSNKVNYEK